MSDNVETMFSAREAPWHRKGTVTPTELTRLPAIQAAGLEWTGDLYPIFAQVGDEWVVARNRQAVVRSSDGLVIGVVGKDYTVIQPAEQFAFVEALLDNPDVEYTTAGMLLSDTMAVSWVTVRVGQGFTAGGEKREQHESYLTIANGYDNRRAFKGMVTPVKTVCANTLLAGWVRASARFAIRHTLNATSRVAEARRLLGVTFDYNEVFQAEVERLIAQEVTDQQFRSIVQAIVPMPEKPTNRVEVAVERKQAALLGVWKGPTVSTGTAWGAICAVNEYELWQRPRGSDDRKVADAIATRQMRSIIVGSQPLTQRAAALVRR